MFPSTPASRIREVKPLQRGPVGSETKPWSILTWKTENSLRIKQNKTKTAALDVKSQSKKHLVQSFEQAFTYKGNK